MTEQRSVDEQLEDILDLIDLLREEVGTVSSAVYEMSKMLVEALKYVPAHE